MTEQVMTQHETKLKLDDEARRALGQVYRLLFSLADEAGLSETREQVSESEEAQTDDLPD
jgi:hypothetical protein